MKEKDIIGYEGLYTITDTGIVYSLGNGKSTNPAFATKRAIGIRVKTNGYLGCKLFKNGQRKHYAVHRLVAITFLPIENAQTQEVNHIDGNKQNNCIDNLEWLTTQQNQKHAFAKGLQKITRGADSKCSKKVMQLSVSDMKPIKVWNSIKEIKREIGYNSVGIIGCCKNKPKYQTAYGFKWQNV